MITTVAIHGFRSLREVVLPLERLTVIRGRNGVGKSSVYRALKLLAATAQGNLNRSLAEVGGFESVLWAGPESVSRAMREGVVPVQGTGRRQGPVSLMLGFTGPDLGYLIDIGLPPPLPFSTAFAHDPEIKREVIWGGGVMRPASQLVRRRNRMVDVRDTSWQQLTDDMGLRDSLISEVSDPGRTPEVLAVRRTLRSWRFYDSFRTDPGSPARLPSPAVWTPVLADDGSDLAAAIQTILESARADDLQRVIARAVGGEVQVDQRSGQLALAVRQQGLLRTLSAPELSDGTLRLLCLAAAMLSPRPPELLVVNEPETSLHPEVLPAVADLMISAAARSQLVVVSHAAELADALAESADDVVVHELIKSTGETTIEGQSGLLSRPAWEWGKR